MTLYVCSVCKQTHHNSIPACPQTFNMKPLTETVTVKREVTGVIADLVNFAKKISLHDINDLSDEQLIKMARDFWESQHGED